ncbi:MAG: hypothetical protein RMY34_24030 [Aulosira sp. DedQUE10]|nr:hypothetical protein [Aulosira sp. DedQUE10]
MPCRLNVYALNFNATVDYLVGFFTKEQLLFVTVRTPQEERIFFAYV